MQAIYTSPLVGAASGDETIFLVMRQLFSGAVVPVRVRVTAVDARKMQDYHFSRAPVQGNSTSAKSIDTSVKIIS